MSISLYDASVGVFVTSLTNLDAILAKAEAYATERKFSPDNFVGLRLAPDMHPLSFQIQSATDRAKLYAARVSGVAAPVWADDEKTFAELRARLRKGLDFLATIPRAAVDGAEDKDVTIKVRGEDLHVSARDYLLKNATPNVYFHVTTAYNILRHAGVPIGKRDFTG